MLKRIFLLPVLGTLLMCSPLLSLSSNKSVTVKADSSRATRSIGTGSTFVRFIAGDNPDITDYRGTYLIVNKNKNENSYSIYDSENPHCKDGTGNAITSGFTADDMTVVVEESNKNLLINAAITIEKHDINNDGVYEYYIKNHDGEYLTYTRGNELSENEEPTTAVTLFDTDSYTDIKVGGNRFANKNGAFVFSSSTLSSMNTRLYKYDATFDSDVDSAVGAFMDSMYFLKTDVCPNGITESDWDTANSGTSSFTADVFGYLGNVTYVHDTETSGSLEDCIDLYDYIVSKYGYTDYLKRKGSSAYQDNYNHFKIVPLVGDNNVTNNGIWLSVIVSSLVVTSLITFIVIKRYRKD